MSRPARIALGIVAVAVLVLLFLTDRWQRDAASALAQWHVLKRTEGEAQQRLLDLERDAKLRADAVTLVGKSASTVPTDAALQKIRGLVIQALDDESPARLEVRAGPAPALATVSLSTTGDFKELVDLASTLSRPSTGLVVGRVSFGRNARRVSLDLEALALGTGSAP